jgi:hypothetical protein
MMEGRGHKFINMVIHDCLGSGINPYSQATEIDVYGCLIYYNGRQTDRAGYAYGSYMQNITGRKLIRENVCFYNWSMGIHAYESGGADLDSILYEGNAVFANGLFYEPNKWRANFFLGGDANHTADYDTLRNNYFYYPPSPSAGQYNIIGHTAGATNLALIGNYFVSPGYYALQLNSTQNTIVGNLFLGHLAGVSSSTYPTNTYLTAWPQTRPADVFVRANQFERGRGHVIVYNWGGGSTVQADLSRILTPGDRYVIKDAMNYYGPAVATGTYGGGAVGIPMAGLTIVRPEGAPIAQPFHTAPRFGVFVILKQSAPGGTGVGERSGGVPKELGLRNFPNPFNASTTIEFEIGYDAFVDLRVYDVLGRDIETLVSGEMTAGLHRVSWRSEATASGILYARLSAGGVTSTRMMTLLK